jgi:hypothetical protein
MLASTKVVLGVIGLSIVGGLFALPSAAQPRVAAPGPVLDVPADALTREAKIAADHVAAVKLDEAGSWAGGNVADLSVGWEFETTDRVRVTELGVWNREGKPLDVDMPVAIWDDAGHVVATTTLPAGDGSIALGEFRYKSIQPVDLAAGKRYVIAALRPPKTKVGEVIGNGATMTTAGPIRWIKPRRAPTRGLALPEARAAEGTTVGSFGPNFLMAPSDATKRLGTFYQSRYLGSPPRQQVFTVPERADGSHRDENVLDITLYADREGKLTQILMNDKLLGAGQEALDGLGAEMKRSAKLPAEQRPVIRVAAMNSVKKEDRQAVMRLTDRDFLVGVVRDASDGIVPLAASGVKQPSRDGVFADADRFKDHDQYIEDRWTGLLWQKDGLAAGKRNFYEAKEYAEKLELGGMKEWRVPTAEELRTIFPANFAPFNETTYNPNKCCGGDKEFSAYWTSELDLRSNDYAYVFQWYDTGGANNCFASKNFVYVRCVHDPVPGRN